MEQPCRLCGERSQERIGIGVQTRYKLTGAWRGQVIEGGPTVQEARPGRDPVLDEVRGRRRGEQEQALAQWAPRPVAIVRDRCRMQVCDGRQHAVQRRSGQRGSPILALPGDQVIGEVWHEHRHGGPIGGRTKVRRHDGCRQGQLAGRHEPFAQGMVARGPGDPVLRPRRPLQDEPTTVRPRHELRQGGAGPAVVGKREFGRIAQSVLRQEVRQRPFDPVGQHGAGTSADPSGPPSR